MMRFAALILLGTIGLGAGLPVTSVTAATPAARDWAKMVTRTPAGAFVIGNPAAKVKLIEYLSLTCPHCGHFAQEAYGPLTAGYIRPGTVSLEIRHAVRDPFDLTASLLARCAGPAAYLAAVETVFAKQEAWEGKGQDYVTKNGAELEKKPLDAQLSALAGGTGLDAIFTARGLVPARQAACLTDKAEQKLLTAQASEAWRDRKIPGTPAFLVNGTLVADKLSWAELEPVIKAAVR